MTEPDHEEPVPTDPGRPMTRAARLAVGTAVLAGEQITGGARTAGGRTVAVFLGLFEKSRDRAENARNRVRTVIDEAERRGRESLAGGRHEAVSMADGAVNSAVNGAVAWAQVRVVPKMIDDLVPHLISDVVPRLIDGALPEIKARVIPALIDDLTNDPRVRELILAQSRGVLGQVTEQLRTGTSRADDRFEATAHRIFGRNDKGAGTGTGAGTATGTGTAGNKGLGNKGLNEIRGA